MLPSILTNSKDRKHRTIIDNKDELCAYLGFNAVLSIMAENHPSVRDSIRNVIFDASVISEEDIKYRQQVMRDAINNKDLLFKIFNTVFYFKPILRKKYPI